MTILKRLIRYKRNKYLEKFLRPRRHQIFSNERFGDGSYDYCISSKKSRLIYIHIYINNTYYIHRGILIRLSQSK